ncbi:MULTISPECIES: restriction endonuclease subunit S [Streptomyces]|uniref:restriction endonuclease subunit S n=1 Tax=Streptomyces TaxID=1883 RepID=UPI000996EF72|nr:MULTISPECIES: restriction endonuclease subunit S [Streptomyces]
MKTTIRLRHLAQINPGTPPFDRLPDDEEMTFLPMEAVWPDSRLDISQRRVKKSVSTGYTRFQNGDILVPKITPTFEAGRAVLIQGLFGGVGAGTTELHVLRPGRDIDPRFLLYVVNTHRFLKLGQAEMYGVAGQQRVPDSFLRDLPVLLPSLSEQRRIVEFLNTETARIDGILRARTEQLSLLQDRRAALKTQSVTYSEPDAVHHPILGSLNPEWKVVPLRRVLPAINVGVVINPSHYFTDSGVPFIHGFNVREGFISMTGMKYMTAESNEAHRRSKVYAGDVLVVRAGATAGRASMVGDEFNGANCASVLILRKSETVYPRYLEAFINSMPGKGQVSFSQYGAAQEVISAGQVGSFLMSVPPLREQASRLSRLAAATARTVTLEEKLQRQVRLLQERRQSLITAAVTGQFDVTTASGRNVTEGASA